jgi:hypothetical protein
MFNRKLNERIDLLFQRIDSLTEKIVEVDSKLVSLKGDVTNISFRVSNLDITTKSLSDEMDEFGKLNMVVMSETNAILNDIEYLTKKLHDAKVINAKEYYENGDDYCPIEEAEVKKQDSEKDNVVLGLKSEAIGIEGGEFVIGKPKSDVKEIDGELIKQIRSESKRKVVISKKDREFFRIPFYRKLPQRFHLLTAVGIGKNMGLSQYNVEKLLGDYKGVTYYEEKSPKIFVLIKQLPQD